MSLDGLNLQLSTQILICTVITIAIVLVFPLLQFAFPKLYRPKATEAERNNQSWRERIFWFVFAFNFRFEDPFVRMYFSLHDNLIWMFFWIALTQAITTLPLHVLSHEEPMFWVAQLSHNIPSKSALQLLPLLDVAVCVMMVEIFTKRFLEEYAPVKQSFNQSRYLLLERHVGKSRVDERLETKGRVVAEFPARVQRLLHNLACIMKLESRGGRRARQKAVMKRVENDLIVNDFSGFPRSYIVEYDSDDAKNLDKIRFARPDMLTKVRQCPQMSDLVRQNLNIIPEHLFLRRVLYLIIVVALIAFYFFPQQLLLSAISTTQSKWYEQLTTDFCEAAFCRKFFQIVFVLVPMSISGSLIGTMTFCVWWLSPLWGFSSNTSRRKLSFITLTVIFCFFWGFLSLFLPTSLYDNFIQSMRHLMSIGLRQFLYEIGSNLSVQTLIFMQFVVVKYVLFPAFAVVRIPHILQYLFKRLILCQRKPRLSAFDYHMRLGYFCHLALVGLMFAPVAPVQSIVVCFCLIVISVVDRYNLRYVSESMDQLSNLPDCFQSVFAVVRSGVIFQLAVLICYYAHSQFSLALACQIILGLFLLFYLARSVSQQRKIRALCAEP